MEEQVTHIDKNENELGVVSRKEAHEKRLLHRIAVVYLVHANGDILIQERMSGKLDHSAAGHVDVGESYLDAAKRELAEELGVNGVTLTEIGDSISGGDDIEPPYHKAKIFAYIGEPGKINTEEVKSVFWQNPKHVLEDMKNDTKGEKYASGFKSSLKVFSSVQPKNQE